MSNERRVNKPANEKELKELFSSEESKKVGNSLFVTYERIKNNESVNKLENK